MLACSSPSLFAAYRVLHRLSMPRHPPYALCSLTSARYFAALLRCFLLAFGRRTFNVRLSQARRCASSCDKITSHLSLAIKGIIQWYMMLLVFSNYPKMWFYLQLRTMLPLSYYWIGKIFILFLCSFQGTSARYFSTLLCCFFLAFGQRTILCTFRSGSSSRLVLWKNHFAYIGFTLFSVPSKLDNATGQMIRPG